MSAQLLVSESLLQLYMLYLIGYAADPSVADASAPDAVIGDVEKFKEMKGSYF